MASYPTAQQHVAWCCKYSATALACFAGSLVAWPARGGFVLLAVGYFLVWRASYHRRRARVLP